MWFKKDKKKDVVEKSNDFFRSSSCSSPVNQVNHRILSPQEAVKHYERAAPVADAVDLIASEIANIRPVVRDKKNKVFIDDHPILDLLDNPNTNETYGDFIQQFTLFYLVTGNNYTLAVGPSVDKPPTEISIVPAQSVYLEPDSRDGLVESMHITGGSLFKRDILSYRFFDGPKASATGEIYQSKRPSTEAGIMMGDTSKALLGMSPLTPHLFDLYMYEAISVHNISLLERGAWPSLWIQSKMPLDEDMYAQMQKSLSQWVGGAANAGRPLLTSESDFEVTQISENEKDMDFYNLKKQVTESLFRTYKIPLPLVSSDTMTLSNYSQANTVFYMTSVLPTLKYILRQLGDFLLQRYPRSEDLELTFDPETIAALEPLRLERLKALSDLNVTTINEMRQNLNLEELAGGTEVYRLATEVPVASSTGVVPEPPIQQGAPDQQAVKFLDLMRQQVDSTGGSLYSDDQIKAMYALESYKCATK
jgi:phage portal protein BeeE